MYGYKVPLKQKDTTRPCGILNWNNLHISAPGHFVRNVQVGTEDMSFIFIPSSVSLHHTNESSISIHISPTHTERDNTSPVIFIVMPHYILLFFFLFLMSGGR